MKYSVPNANLVNKYKNLFQDLEKGKNDKKCLIGSDIRYRITIQDSYFHNISDTDVIFEYCLYPLYVNGDIDIKNRIQKRLLEMANASDVLEVFQVYNFIMSQDMLCRIYTDVPFMIDFSDIINTLISKMGSYEQDMKEYRANGFDSYRESLWDNVQRILRKSVTLKKYIV